MTGAGLRLLPAWLYLALGASLLLPARPAAAAAAVSCHCFRDRSFDPSFPARSDPYFLATMQNTFFALAFDVPKGDVVKAKMSGANPDDLWSAHYAGRLLRRDPASLLASRSKGVSWPDILPADERAKFPPGDRFAVLLGSRPPAGSARLAAAAALETLADRLAVRPEALAPAAEAARSTGELVAASLLSRWLDRPAATVLDEIRKGGGGWGEPLHRLGIDGDSLEGRVRQIIGRDGQTGP